MTHPVGFEAGGVDPLGSSIWHVDRTNGTTTLISGTPDQARALVVVRDNPRISAVLTIDGTDRPAADPAVAAVEPAPTRPWAEGAGAGLQATVVMCTMGSCDILGDAVRSVLAQNHDNFDLVVVDNAPSTGGTRRALADINDSRMTIVNASTPGLSRARNRGVLAAQGDFIAFTDDDAILDPNWLTALLDPFAASPLVGATTGIVVAAELRSQAQRWFEARGGFPKDLTARVWTIGNSAQSLAGLCEPGEGGPLYPMTTARVGAGVCMAMRREVLMEVGPFDPALGAGTPTRGGEDLDMFARIMRAGYAIIHTPDALVHHRHRTDLAGLDTQIRGNGSGMAALIVKSVMERPGSLVNLVGRIPGVLQRVAPGSERVSGTDEDVPGSLTKSEIKGFLEGAGLYLRSRRANRISAWPRG
ncbi:glycosyltransferase family 2 protein [Schaalia vaccimaxillae]|uniref:glycosyltransferase family 2 protein n=1 Tax=Schaalia vaccimaxillae TaxID=183916 RepID=UPI0003B3D2A6|nr:glycosyltransferase [Schaalia vaccimaxillae]